MALTDESSGIPATMLVGPANIAGNQPYPVYMGQGGGNNGFGDNGWWVILLIIIVMAAGGWNNNGNNGGGFGGGMPVVVNESNGVQRGFDQAAVMSGIGGIQSGVQNLSTQLCSCCGDMQMALANGFAGVEQGANARQMANMQTAFAGQMAMSQGFNALQGQLAECCCENRLATAQTQNILARESAETRFADANNTRDIIENQTRGNQLILDKLCQLELDAKNDKINDLERQLTMANFAASQTAQTARLERSNSEVIDGLYNRLATCPVGTMPVYGNQPIFTCPNNNNNGCGCGCGM